MTRDGRSAFIAFRQERDTATHKKLTYVQTAKLLGCSRRTVNRFVTDHLLNPHREGHRSVSFDRAEVLKLKPILQSDRKQLIIRVKGGAITDVKASHSLS